VRYCSRFAADAMILRRRSAAAECNTRLIPRGFLFNHRHIFRAQLDPSRASENRASDSLVMYSQA
jgi:hypothetical protein